MDLNLVIYICSAILGLFLLVIILRLISTSFIKSGVTTQSGFISTRGTTSSNNDSNYYLTNVRMYTLPPGVRTSGR